MNQDSPSKLDELLSSPSPTWVVLLALIYIALVVLVRWQMIATPLRHQLDARRQVIQAEARELAETTPKLAERILALFKKEAGERQERFDALFWSRGKETAIWLLIDKAEAWLVDTWAHEKLVARMETMRAALLPLDSPVARALCARIDRKLDSRVPAPTAALRELYKEALRTQRESLVRYDVDYDVFNNKLLWHIVISLITIVIVANVGPVVAKSCGFDELWRVGDIRALFILLLVAGAVGGVLSRLTRAITTRSVQGGGLSWMAMFLSPVAGALAGWAGAMILLTAQKLNLVLTQMEPQKLTLILLGAAVLLGFSERTLTDIAERLDQHFLPRQAEPASSRKGTQLPQNETDRENVEVEEVNQAPARPRPARPRLAVRPRRHLGEARGRFDE